MATNSLKEISRLQNVCTCKKKGDSHFLYGLMEVKNNLINCGTFKLKNEK